MTENNHKKTYPRINPLLETVSSVKSFTNNVRLFTDSLEQLLNSLENFAPTLEVVAQVPTKRGQNSKNDLLEFKNLSRADVLIQTVGTLKDITRNVQIFTNSLEQVLNSLENFAPALQVVAKKNNFKNQA